MAFQQIQEKRFTLVDLRLGQGIAAGQAFPDGSKIHH